MNNRFLQWGKSRPLLFKCIAASLVLHGVVLSLWLIYPVSFSRYVSLFFPFSSQSTEIENGQERDQVGSEDFFAKVFSSRPVKKEILAESLPSLRTEKILGEFLREEPTKEVPVFARKQPEPLSSEFPNQPLSDSDLVFSDSVFPLAKIQACFHLPEKELLPPPSLHPFPEYTFESLPPITKDPVVLSLPASPVKETGESSPLRKQSQNPLPSLASVSPVGSEILPIPSKEILLPMRTSACSRNTNLPEPVPEPPTLARLDEIFSSESLYSMERSENFSVSSSFFPEEEGYVFSVSLALKEEAEAPKISQNFYFLIDVSSNLENHKITVFKRSVLKALSSLQSGDRFNIVLLDKKPIRLSPSLLPFSFENLRKAENFLEKRHDRPVFASFDLFRGLDEVLDTVENDDEVHTAILLTNGKLPGSLSAIRKNLVRFLKKNNGTLSFHTVAGGKNNDLVFLDMISSLSGGKLLYSDTNASLPRKLGALIKTLQKPLMQNVSVTLKTKDPKAGIVLFSGSVPSSRLYGNEPFTVMGHIDRLSDLEIFLEGKNEEGPVSLTKEISFAPAEEASVPVKKEWSFRQTAPLYHQFLEHPDSEILSEAREILKIEYGRTLGT